MGASGCGKTTLLELVAGLKEPSRGSCKVMGQAEARGRLKQCALMPQKDLLLPWRNALDNACLALENQGMRRSQAHERAATPFKQFGLEGFEGERPSRLSGGMRQRVAFLRTMLAGKDVLLLDEPFGALDSITRAQMQGWLLEMLASEPRTVLLVTHDVEEALFLCDRVAVMSKRPARIALELVIDLERDGPRHDLVTSAQFSSLKERALEALEL